MCHLVLRGLGFSEEMLIWHFVFRVFLGVNKFGRDRQEVELGSGSQIVIHVHEALMGQNHRELGSKYWYLKQLIWD